MGNNTSITQCSSCDGELTFNPSAQTLDCPFCKSRYTLQGEAIAAKADISEVSKLIVPFSFAKEVFDKAALLWLSQGEYTPGDILDSFHASSTKGVYIPLYVWDISYSIASAMGSKPGQTTAIALGEDQKKQPAELIVFAKALAKMKGGTKPFDKVYTLGFDILEEDEAGDNTSHLDKADALARETIIVENKLPDGKGITISKLALTKVYVAFWMNKYSYQSQNYEVFMTGADASKIGGTRPMDVSAMNASKPSFKYAFLILLLSFIMMAVAFYFMPNTGSKPGVLITGFLVVIGTCMFLGFPVMLIITIIRRMAWINPVGKLKKERDEKLAQHLVQRN